MFENALVGVDGRSGGRDAIALAAQLLAPHGRLTLAHVYGSALLIGRGAALALPEEREHALQMLRAEREAAGVRAELVLFEDVAPARGLHTLAELHHFDLLVVGSCHHGLLGRVLLGDDAADALNGAPCATAIAPYGYGNMDRAVTRVGVGFDGSPESERALAAARGLAARHGARIAVLAVVSLDRLPEGMAMPDDWPVLAGQMVVDELHRLRDIEGVDADAVYGDPGEELARFARRVDLLVVGSRGHGPWGRLMHGSVSNYLLRRRRGPLLVLPRSAAAIESQPPVSREPARALPS
jgi:nucleotide-binding universal stress UspA family protein